METIGSRIEALRLELGLKKSDIWQGAGLSSGIYSQWLNGQSLKG
jgi:transcriptional regulator with XRE-family HTH domain